MDIEAIQKQISAFAQERDWESFHTIRNLIFALVGEVGELAESVQWLGEIDQQYLDRNPQVSKAIREEVADVFIYLVRLSDIARIDLGKAVEEKLASNALRYTVEKSKGNAEKH